MDEMLVFNDKLSNETVSINQNNKNDTDKDKDKSV